MQGATRGEGVDLTCLGDKVGHVFIIISSFSTESHAAPESSKMNE